MAELDSQYVRIQRAIWNKTTFKSLSDDGKLLFFYIDTCPHGNLMNYFMLPPGYACEDLGWDRKRFTKGLGELFDKGLVEHDERTGVVLDLHHLLKFPPQNPNQVKAAIAKLGDIPKNSLYQSLINIVEKLPEGLVKPLLERLRQRLGEYVEVEVEVEVDKRLAQSTAYNCNGKFDKFWEAYPKKKSKGDAEKAFKALKIDDPTLSVILEVIEKAKASEEWSKDGGQYIPYPATWLRAKGWLDEFGERKEYDPWENVHD